MDSSRDGVGKTLRQDSLLMSPWSAAESRRILQPTTTDLVGSISVHSPSWALLALHLCAQAQFPLSLCPDITMITCTISSSPFPPHSSPFCLTLPCSRVTVQSGPSHRCPSFQS